MQPDQVINSLRNHANLQIGGDGSKSILRALWLRGSDATHPQLGALSDDVLDLLGSLNTRWNTANPEAVSGKVAEIERMAVSSLTEIIACGRAFTTTHPGDQDALKALFKIETAWRAVLAGDISDLRRHIKEIEAAS